MPEDWANVALPIFEESTKIAPVLSERITWSRLTAKTSSHCQMCMDLINNSQTGYGYPQRAKWRREHKGAFRYLCSEHAQDQRDEDG